MLKKSVYLLLLSFASLIAIYPVLYILGVSLRPDNAFNVRSLAIIPPNASFQNSFRSFATPIFFSGCVTPRS